MGQPWPAPLSDSATATRGGSSPSSTATSGSARRSLPASSTDATAGTGSATTPGRGTAGRGSSVSAGERGRGLRMPCGGRCREAGCGRLHARFDRGPLAKQQPRRAGTDAPTGKPAGLSPAAHRSLTSQRPTSPLPGWPVQPRATRDTDVIAEPLARGARPAAGRGDSPSAPTAPTRSCSPTSASPRGVPPRLGRVAPRSVFPCSGSGRCWSPGRRSRPPGCPPSTPRPSTTATTSCDRSASANSLTSADPRGL